jgi:UDP-N-acetylmuramate-alanine ligase
LAEESDSLYAPDGSDVEKILASLIGERDKPKVVVFLGAGSIGRWAKEVTAKLLS